MPAVDFLQTEGVTSYDCMKYQNKRETCRFSCDNPSKPYLKYYCKPGSIQISTEVEDIQRDIYNNGPVMVGMLIYEDFYSYKDGIYHYTTGGLVGGHAIRTVGWGHDDDDQLYWIVQN